MSNPARPRATLAAIRTQFGAEPFRLSDAEVVGISRGRVRAAVAAGLVVRLRQGVLVDAAVVDACRDPVQRHLLDARGVVVAMVGPGARGGLGGSGGLGSPVALGGSGGLAGRAGGGSGLAALGGPVLSFSTGSVLHGWPYPGILTPARWPVEATVASESRCRSSGWRSHRADLPAEHVITVDGLPVTSMSRTAADIAVQLPLVDSMPVLDAAMRSLVLVAADISGQGWSDERCLVRDPRLVTAARHTLLLALAETHPVHARRRALRALRSADPGAENAFESVSRASLLAAGLPAPQAGVAIVGDDGRTYWVDLAWPELRVVGEADGRLKYTDPAALYAEKRRQDALERAGWIVVRWTWDELAFRPRVVVARVAAALERARCGRRTA